ncbi:MAG: DUF5597 domain-containing protein [Treponema sp.]|jgi:hypothetical protein|nr:DUF5597 domain-containing protein [Treponema sp.]
MKRFEGFSVKGKPFFPLGAQAHNSSSYSRGMFGESIKAALALNCNTVEAPIYWEKIESAEGVFDFSSVDYLVEMCRKSKLALVLLWFASWKNGDLSYAPEWVKRDQSRFQRVLRSDVLPVADLSSHYSANREADERAFTAVLAHLKEIDGAEQTVIAVQVENEPGFMRTDQDYSPKAREDLKAPVPEKLLTYLESHTEAPAYRDWKKHGLKKNAAWADAFGFRGYEYCEAWHLARYIDAIAAAGKAVYDIPLYINVWLNDGTPWGLPGIEYPGGGAVARALHVWLAAVEHIDMIAPDNYMQNSYSYEKAAGFYCTEENALFTPESSPNATGASNMFYAIARGAVGNAIFGSESCLDNGGNVREPALPLRDSNYAVQQALPLIIKHRNTGKMYPVIRHDSQTDAAYEFEEFLGNVHFTGDGAFTDYSTLRETLTPEQKTPRGLIIEDEPKTFYLLGRFSLRLVPKKSPDVSFAGGYVPSPDFVSVEEGHFNDRGLFVTDRIRNGDEAFAAGFWVSCGCGVVRVVLV